MQSVHRRRRIRKKNGDDLCGNSHSTISVNAIILLNYDHVRCRAVLSRSNKLHQATVVATGNVYRLSVLEKKNVRTFVMSPHATTNGSPQ